MQAGSAGSISFTLNVPVSGRYYIWGRTMGADYGSDSFSIQLDSASRVQWGFPNGKPWQWNSMTYTGQYWTLSAGVHILTVWSREAGAKLDALEITDQNPWIYQPKWVAACP